MYLLKTQKTMTNLELLLNYNLKSVTSLNYENAKTILTLKKFIVKVPKECQLHEKFSHNRD